MNKINQKINVAVEYITIFFLVMITIDVSYIVFARYILHHTYPWGEEIALLGFVWMGFFSMALGVRDDTHLKITFYDQFLPQYILNLSNKINKILVLIFSIFGVFLAIKMCFISKFSNLPGTGLNSYVMYLPVLFGFLLTIYYSILNLFFNNKEK